MRAVALFVQTEAGTARCAFAASMILLGASNMRRRLLDRVQSYPLVLMLLAEKPARTICGDRMLLARNMLNSLAQAQGSTPAICAIDSATLKITELHKDELASASECGTLVTHDGQPSVLFVRMAQLRTMMNGCVSENERFNSIIKIIKTSIQIMTYDSVSTGIIS